MKTEAKKTLPMIPSTLKPEDLCIRTTEAAEILGVNTGSYNYPTGYNNNNKDIEIPFIESFTKIFRDTPHSPKMDKF